MYHSFIFIRKDRAYVKVETERIIYIESCRGYLKLATDAKQYLVYTNMLFMEKVLDSCMFSRIHRSYMVNVARIERFDKKWVSVQVSDNTKKLPIAKDRYHDLLKTLVIVEDGRSREKGAREVSGAPEIAKRVAVG